MSLLLLMSLPLWAAQPAHCGGHGGTMGAGASEREIQSHAMHHSLGYGGKAQVTSTPGSMLHSGIEPHAEHAAPVPDRAAPAVTGAPCADCDLGCMAACATVGLPTEGGALPVPLLAITPLPLFSFNPLRAHRVPLLRPPSPSSHC